MIPVYRKVPTHHSVVDWDFGPGMVKELTDITYVSAPSSLHLGNYPNHTAEGVLLCRIDETLVLPQGVIVTAARQRTPTNQYRLIFRNQAVLGTSNELNCYRIQVDAAHWSLYRVTGGGAAFIDDQPAVHSANTWQFLRATFYSGVNPANGSALVVTYELYIAGDWIQQGDPIYDPVDQWKDSGINRVGLGTKGLALGWEQWYDDTEIWGPAP